MIKAVKLMRLLFVHIYFKVNCSYSILLCSELSNTKKFIINQLVNYRIFLEHEKNKVINKIKLFILAE